MRSEIPPSAELPAALSLVENARGVSRGIELASERVGSRP